MTYRMFLIILMLCLPAVADDTTDVEREVAAIRQGVESYTAAYNRGDAAGVASHWSPTAVYVKSESGERIQGRDAIAAMFHEMFQDVRSQLSVKVEAVRLITPEVAIEDGIAYVASEHGAPTTSKYTAVYLKQNAEWLLDSVREYEVVPQSASHPSPLDQLEWMVGQWVDRDELATITTRFEWAKNKSFLTASFKVSVQGQIELEGTQIIGWDPVSEHIRSWVFDSQGGFGAGVWRRVGNQWIVDATSTLADGSQGVATTIYTHVDDGAFKWKSVDRQMNGEPQPDIDEVSVYRE